MVTFVLIVFLMLIPNIKTQAQGGYLFAHMKDTEYGSLFYSISRDGIDWTTLNNGKTVLYSYLGHPNICRDETGTYYMIGVTKFKSPRNPVLYTSKDLISWNSTDLPINIFDTSSLEYVNDSIWFGAPKIFYDEASRQFMITWHHIVLPLFRPAMFVS